ncbi:TolC family protein [Stutzerimonas stutzeri]|uniref:TolC family protein n=1 Tax=Stutzerimonas sp. S1 TaxID=3030652 RepID=UPI00222564D0|nr:TolC family protein [Stutzerimonas sp. S1]MCW3148186.1 TolC family protein [Stutzerimonas sp. S1]
MRDIRARAAVAACALALPAAASALSFDEALALAQQQAPSLQAEAAKLQAARSDAVPAGELPDPKLLLGVQNVPIEGNDRWSLDRDGMTMSMVGLMQDVPNRDKRRARVEVANAGVQRAAAERAVEALNVRQATAQAWIASHAIERKLATFDALYAENRLLSEAVRARIAGGRGQAADSVLPRQEAALLDERADELHRQRRQARAALARWIGKAALEPLEGSVPHWSLDAPALQRELHQHPQLQAYTPMTQQAQARIREATAEKKPDWSWEVDYLRRGQEFGDMVNLQVSFDLPLFTSMRQNPRIAARHAELNQLEAEREALERQFAEQLDNELAELERLQRALTRTREVLLPLARERSELSMADYRAGRGELETLLAARRELIETRLKEIDLEGLQAIAASRLYFAYGDAQ